MEENTDRRKEQRLRYHWPVWFAEDFDEILSQGQMVDISSEGVAFTCYADEAYLCPGQKVMTRFSVPRFEADNAFGMASFTRSGCICRIDQVNDFLRRIAMQFAEPLPFKPGEQTENEQETQKGLKMVTI